MIRAMHCLLALLLLLTPTLSLADSHSSFGIRVERSLEQTGDSATAAVSITVENIEERRAAVDDLPTRLRLSLMVEHGRLIEGVDLSESLTGYEAGRELSEDETRIHWFLLPIAMTVPLYLYWSGNPYALALGALFTPIALVTVFITSAKTPLPDLPESFQNSLLDRSPDFANGAQIGFSISMKNRRMNLVLLGTLTGAALFGLALGTLDEPEFGEQ
ncbi:hypothetical protein KQI52_12245 [bacterium]|nr:hypothetical protein [bacterium]